MKYLSLAAFIVLVTGTGSLIGIFNTPGEWYANIAKPAFNPPNWVFGPVWTLLYICIATAGWRTWSREKYSQGFGIWCSQMALNFAWSPVFFTLHRMDVALGIIILMLTTILLFIRNRWHADPTAARLFIPYAAWVAFACVLNASLLWLN